MDGRWAMGNSRKRNRPPEGYVCPTCEPDVPSHAKTWEFLSRQDVWVCGGCARKRRPCNEACLGPEDTPARRRTGENTFSSSSCGPHSEARTGVTSARAGSGSRTSNTGKIQLFCDPHCQIMCLLYLVEIDFALSFTTFRRTARRKTSSPLGTKRCSSWSAQLIYKTKSRGS